MAVSLPTSSRGSSLNNDFAGSLEDTRLQESVGAVIAIAQKPSAAIKRYLKERAAHMNGQGAQIGLWRCENAGSDR